MWRHLACCAIFIADVNFENGASLMSGTYQHILLAVELDEACDDTPVSRALALAKQSSAKLTVVHSIEHMSSYGAAYGVAAGADIEEMLIENANEAMASLGEKHDISEADLIVKVGPAKSIILEEAERLRRIPFTEKEILRLLNDLIETLKPFLPKAKKKKRNNSWYYSFGWKEIGLIKVEPVHGSRNAIPQRIRNRQVKSVFQVLDIIESQIKEKA